MTSRTECRCLRGATCLGFSPLPLSLTALRGSRPWPPRWVWRLGTEWTAQRWCHSRAGPQLSKHQSESVLLASPRPTCPSGPGIQLAQHFLPWPFRAPWPWPSVQWLCHRSCPSGFLEKTEDRKGRENGRFCISNLKTHLLK